MNAPKNIKKTATTANVPRNEDEMKDMVRATVAAQLSLEGVIAKRDAAQIEAAKPFADEISGLQNLMARNIELLETWADLNKALFGEAKSIVVDSHRLGWKLGNWKTKLKSKVTWEGVVKKLRGFIAAARPVNLRDLEKEDKEPILLRAGFAKAWLRVNLSIEPAKDVMIVSREDTNAKELLGQVGVTVIQEEDFYLAPDREGQADALLTNDK